MSLLEDILDSGDNLDRQLSHDFFVTQDPTGGPIGKRTYEHRIRIWGHDLTESYTVEVDGGQQNLWSAHAVLDHLIETYVSSAEDEHGVWVTCALCGGAHLYGDPRDGRWHLGSFKDYQHACPLWDHNPPAAHTPHYPSFK